MLTSPTTNEFSIYDCPQIIPLVDDKTSKWKLNHIEIAPNCPRCASSNTKFCYYNNYSLSQPRYFCKGCRRYWTKGGSLRNVPVGGGCRKSRRSRAARQAGGTNYATSSALSPGSAGSNGETENGTDIDLAAVFAKYVNQNVENDESYSPGATTSSASLDNFQASSLEIESQMEDISTMFEYQKPLDNLVNGFGDQLHEMIPQISMHQNVSGHDQDFVYQNSDTFELQSIIGDESSADMLWSNDANLQDFGSQESMVQFQDFGLFSNDDQFRMSTNLVSDNWGSFDLSAYELFSRP